MECDDMMLIVQAVGNTVDEISVTINQSISTYCTSIEKRLLHYFF